MLIYAYGTRGDVQPYLALAYALNEAGHHAVLAAPARFAGLAADHGVEFAARDDEWLNILDDPDVRKILSSGGMRAGLDKAARKAVQQRLRTGFHRLLPRILDDTWSAARQGADVVVHSHEYVDQGQQIAEMLGVPAVLALLHPNIVPSREYASGLVPFGTRLPGLLNRLSYVPLRFMRLESATVRHWRTERLGLQERRGQYDMLRRPDGGPVTVLHGFSRHVIRPARDWPDSVHTTGFWLLPSMGRWSPPAELVDFLKSGEQPIFVGFGSLSGLDPEHTGRVIRDAVQQAGVRAVVNTGWQSIRIAEPSDRMFVIDQVPYDWLFSRVRLVVHAGSAGVVNEALAAGVPHVACPLHREQEIWASRVHELGLAPAPIRQRDLTVDNLAAAIRQALADSGARDRAQRLCAEVRAEDGARTAARIVAGVHEQTRRGTTGQPPVAV